MATEETLFSDTNSSAYNSIEFNLVELKRTLSSHDEKKINQGEDSKKSAKVRR